MKAHAHKRAFSPLCYCLWLAYTRQTAIRMDDEGSAIFLLHYVAVSAAIPPPKLEFRRYYFPL